MIDSVHLTRMKRIQKYDPVGRCIYCGAVEGRLTGEHIIPKSLGGMLILPEATCHTCADETGALEGRCTGHFLRPARRTLRLPQRNRGSKYKNKPETFIAEADGRSINVDPQEFPALLMMFSFDPPGILVNAQPTEHFAGYVTVNQLPDFQGRLGRLRAKHRFKGNPRFPVGEDATDHGRMLAKIAHCYAVAELGLGAFKPFLSNIILNKPPLHLGHFVGGHFGEPSHGDDLHEIAINPIGLWGQRWVAIKIQLFANRAMPTYLVIAGERP